jgi:hypothetical protein
MYCGLEIEVIILVDPLVKKIVSSKDKSKFREIYDPPSTFTDI